MIAHDQNSNPMCKERMKKEKEPAKLYFDNQKMP
jgi:hypothetical protein